MVGESSEAYWHQQWNSMETLSERILTSVSSVTGYLQSVNCENFEDDLFQAYSDLSGWESYLAGDSGRTLTNEEITKFKENIPGLLQDIIRQLKVLQGAKFCEDAFLLNQANETIKNSLKTLVEIQQQLNSKAL